ncbi:MAG: GyrI-like domain-containing protein [Eubacteriaceae bacterium]|nr:GyrI-like domain-containing protein [Eubacteriaceae bacterium]
MSKLKNMRGIEIPRFRALSSGPKTLKELFGPDGFDEWAGRHQSFFARHIYEPTAFLWHEDEAITWESGYSILAMAIDDSVTEADVAPYEIIEFPGGIFLVATGDENDPSDLNETVQCMMEWIESSNIFEYGDFPKSGMCNMPNPNGAFDTALGIAQQQIYLPLKMRAQSGQY